MPHIKSIRVTNVHFNNATQFYDDFNLELGGRNTTYDLENGGGKSLLLLMLLQTVLPKSNLRKEKPVSLLFQGGKDRTSHGVVEWNMEDNHGYKYLLTGFCARKRKGAGAVTGVEGADEDERLPAADIEHLNWCVFYNDHSLTGIRSVPLVTEAGGEKRYAGFEDIRRYIQQMRHKGLPAEIFEGIDKYQHYLSAHNLISAEWQIIRGINSGENSIESYFRQNTTSRKLIENQFVKIVEDVEALNSQGQSNETRLLLADTLIQIRSRLNEYLQLKGHLGEYEKIKAYYQEFARKNDELLQSFTVLEGYKQEAAGIRQLLLDNLDGLERQKAAVMKRQASNAAGSREGQQLQRLLQAGLINYQKLQMSAQKRAWELERDRLREKDRQYKQHLNRLLTLEGYGDYRKVKGRLNENRQRLQFLEEDEDVTKAAYRAAGGRLSFLLTRRGEELTGLSQSLGGARQKLSDDLKKIRQELIGAEKENALLEAAVDRLTQAEQDGGIRLTQLNNYFLGRGEMEAALAPEQFLEPFEDELTRHRQARGAVDEQIIAGATLMQSMEIKAVKMDGEIDRNLEIQQQCRTWLKQYGERRSRLEYKARAFNQDTIQAYGEELERIIRREELHRLEKEIEAGRLRQKQQLSLQRGYYVPNEEVLALAGYLHDKCEFVKAGIDWLADLEPEERAEVLQALPYLPFAVIVDNSAFTRLRQGRLKVPLDSDYLLPIVNLELLRQNPTRGTDDIYYYCNFSGLLLDRTQYERYMEQMSAALADIDAEMAAGAARSAELSLELAELREFKAVYPQDEVDEHQQRLEALTQAGKGLQICRADAELQRERARADREALVEQLEMQSEAISECQEKLARLRETIQTSQELAATRAELTKKRKTLNAVQGAIDNLGILSGQLEQDQEQNQTRLHQLGIELHELNKEREELSSFASIENEGSLLEARAEYRALHESVSGRTLEEDRLRNELADWEGNLKSLGERIRREYDGDLAAIENSEMNGMLITIPDQTMIARAKQDKAVNKKDLSTLERKVIEIDIRVENAAEKLDEIMDEEPRLVLEDLPDYDNEDRYRLEIDNVDQLIKSYDQEVARDKEQLAQIDREEERLQVQVEDYQEFMDRETVTISAAAATEIKDFRRFEKEFRRVQDSLQLQLQKWGERINTINTETTAFVIREPVEELGKISRPVSTGLCRRHQAAFVEYMTNIDEQMQKIGHDISLLESYQQDFTRRCIQRAELLLGQLRKLEPLSRIEVYGRRINMIELRLPELEPQDKQLRMKAHIDGIVREIGEEGTVDRKRIAARLSSQELLGQIADMDKAMVRLYKVESIPENSRFYRWEQAIGSEGQNNSLYFIFAACLISFIRMLSIHNTGVRTKKVIIADNPFGSTSAVYLWDPMFKILKQNDIQLIAPGHKITPEITSRFGVNYLLNQDILQDGRIRVVVKDVRVEEDEDRMRFMDAEQLSMF